MYVVPTFNVTVFLINIFIKKCKKTLIYYKFKKNNYAIKIRNTRNNDQFRQTNMLSNFEKQTK